MSSILVGFHAIAARLEKSPESIFAISVLEGKTASRLEALLKQAKALGIPVKTLPRKTFDKLAGDSNHQGVLAECRPSKPSDLSIADCLAGQAPYFFLILDGVQDPHNLGACLRSADAAGVTAVIIPKDKAASVSPTVHKVSSGAADSVPIITVTNLARAIEELKAAGVWIYGAAGEADTLLYQVDFRGSIALVLGQEGSGMRRMTREHCDGLFRIPMAGQVESLNVSVATGISLFEVVRQRATYS